MLLQIKTDLLTGSCRYILLVIFYIIYGAIAIFVITQIKMEVA